MNKQLRNKIYRILFTTDESSWKSTLFYESEDQAYQVCLLLHNSLAGIYNVSVVEEPRLKLVNS